MPHLATLKGKMPPYAWTWLDNRDYDGWRRKFEALRDADLDGYFLWCWESDLTPRRWPPPRESFDRRQNLPVAVDEWTPLKYSGSAPVRCRRRG